MLIAIARHHLLLSKPIKIRCGGVIARYSVCVQVKVVWCGLRWAAFALE
jgi:hypothetical protein